MAVATSTDQRDEARRVLMNGPCLVLLDNLEIPGDVDRQSPSRPVFRSIELQALDISDALALFDDITERAHVDNPDCRSLIAQLEGIPGAVEVIGHEAKDTNNLRWIVQRWKSIVSEGESGLPASLHLSLASPRCDDDQRRLFALLGRLPAGIASADLQRLLPQRGQDAACRLHQRAMAIWHDDRIDLTLPVHEFAARQEADPAVVTDAVHLYLELATQGFCLGGPEGSAATVGLAAELSNIAFAIDEWPMGQTDSRYVIAGLARFIAFTGLGDAGPIKRFRLRLQKDGRVQEEACCVQSLAGIAHARSDYVSSRRLYKEAIGICRQTKDLSNKATFFCGALVELHWTCSTPQQLLLVSMRQCNCL